MSQDPFCQTWRTIQRPGYTGLIQGRFFSTCTILKIYKARQKIPNLGETTVLVGIITKAVCVH